MIYFVVLAVLVFAFGLLSRDNYRKQYAGCPDTNYFLGKSDRDNMRVFFFQTNDSYSKMKDAKKMYSESFLSKELLENSEKQEELNKSKRVKKILKKQKQQERLLGLRQMFMRFQWRDVYSIALYIILPVVCIWALEIPAVNSFFQELFMKVSHHRADMYLSQVSLTFITISLMSIFSDTNVVIYWENIVKKVLIDPPTSCFKAYFVYSFAYLFLATVSLFFSYDVGFVVFFSFNVICLFDLSRTMINCYYDPNKKKKVLIRDFISKIERANREHMSNMTEEKNTNTQYDIEVKATLDDFNYYINESFNDGKYYDVKEDLEVYGKLIAHINTAVISAEDLFVLDWYTAKTYKAYIGFVKSFYDECYSMELGIVFCNGQPLSMSNLSVETNVIDRILVTMLNDVPSVFDKIVIHDLLFYQFFVYMFAVARKVDGDNLDRYIKNVENGRQEISFSKDKEDIRDIISRLNAILQKKEVENGGICYAQAQFYFALVRLIGNIILLNTQDEKVLRMDFLCWDEFSVEKREAIMQRVFEYVMKKSQNYSEERKAHCIKRMETWKESR